jgi:LacI family transcriptional regulator
MTTTRPTIRDVARLAGVSHQTVSRVINGALLVSTETRQRVDQAIQTLGFRPNAIARSMAQGQTFTLACLSPNLTDFTFASIIEGAVNEARTHGYFLLSAPCNDEDSFATLVDELVNSRRTDGLIVINPYIDGRFHFLSPQFPVVYVGAPPRGEPFNSVALDNRDGAGLAVRHLVDLGHTKIATITGPLTDDSAVERDLGFRAALVEAGITIHPSWIVQGDWSATSGYEAFHTLAQAAEFPSAVFAQNDRMAIGLMRAAAEAGLHIPDELSIIGFDDMPLASYFTPPLTTLSQDMWEIGRIASRLLIQKAENPLEPPTHTCVAAHLVIRATTKAVKQ